MRRANHIGLLFVSGTPICRMTLPASAMKTNQSAHNPLPDRSNLLYCRETASH